MGRVLCHIVMFPFTKDAFNSPHGLTACWLAARSGPLWFLAGCLPPQPAVSHLVWVVANRVLKQKGLEPLLYQVFVVHIISEAPGGLD